MGKHFKHPATVIAAVALFAALGGGAAAYAGGLISGSKIKNHSIPENKLTKSAVKTLTSPGGKILTYDATGGAPTSQPTTIGTVLGVTFGATCVTVAGNSTLTLFGKTPNGAWAIDFSDASYDGGSSGGEYVNSANYPPGTASQFIAADQATAAAGANETDRQLEGIQLKPQPGVMLWHTTAVTTKTPSSTCHATIEAFPEPITAVVAGAAHAPGGAVTRSHGPLLFAPR